MSDAVDSLIINTQLFSPTIPRTFETRHIAASQTRQGGSGLYVNDTSVAGVDYSPSHGGFMGRG